MRVFAVRHKSGNYLTDKWEGTSYWEGEPYKGNARLFSTIAAAKTWRTCWLKGRVKKVYDGDGEFWELTYVPVPSRHREDIEIIPVLLTFDEENSL